MFFFNRFQILQSDRFFLFLSFIQPKLPSSQPASIHRSAGKRQIKRAILAKSSPSPFFQDHEGRSVGPGQVDGLDPSSKHGPWMRRSIWWHGGPFRIPTTDSWHVWLPGWRRGRRPQRGQSLCDTLFKGWSWCLEVCLLESYSDLGNRNIVLGEPQVWQNTAQKLGCVLICEKHEKIGRKRRKEKEERLERVGRQERRKKDTQHDRMSEPRQKEPTHTTYRSARLHPSRSTCSDVNLRIPRPDKSHLQELRIDRLAWSGQGPCWL